MRMRGPVVYPLLAAAYPVLALAAANPGEIPGLWVLAWPVGLSLFIAVCAWTFLGLVIRDPDRRAFITFMVVFLFASYGYFTLSLEEVAWAAPHLHTPLPFLFLGSYLAAATYLVFRFVPNLRRLTRFLTIVTNILVLWNLAVLLQERTRTYAVDRDVGGLKPVGSGTGAGKSGGPDIYLLVLDKYPGSRSLKSNFDFDNAAFEAFLRQRGFILPRHATANYIYTGLSLASLLNYRYLDSLSPQPRAQRRNKAYVNHLVEDNAVW